METGYENANHCLTKKKSIHNLFLNDLHFHNLLKKNKKKKRKKEITNYFFNHYPFHFLWRPEKKKQMICIDNLLNLLTFKRL